MDLVTIQRFEYPWQAAMARNRLEADGIRTFLQQENSMVTEGIFNQVVGGIQLQVSAADAERASALIGNMEFTAAPEEGEEEDGNVSCLSCGAVIPPETSVCPKCGWSYRAGTFGSTEES